MRTIFEIVIGTYRPCTYRLEKILESLWGNWKSSKIRFVWLNLEAFTTLGIGFSVIFRFTILHNRFCEVSTKELSSKLIWRKKDRKINVRNNFVIGLNFVLRFDERTRITWWLTFSFQIINILRREIVMPEFLIYNLWLQMNYIKGNVRNWWKISKLSQNTWQLKVLLDVANRLFRVCRGN